MAKKQQESETVVSYDVEALYPKPLNFGRIMRILEWKTWKDGIPTLELAKNAAQNLRTLAVGNSEIYNQQVRVVKKTTTIEVVD